MQKVVQTSYLGDWQWVNDFFVLSYFLEWWMAVVNDLNYKNKNIISEMHRVESFCKVCMANLIKYE